MIQNLFRVFSITSLLLAAMMGLTRPASAEEAVAKIQQGNMEVGGNASFSTFQYAGGSVTSISINPTVQYFLIDHLSVGGAVSWGHDFSDSGVSSIFFGPAATYYFMAMDKLVPFVSEQFGYSHLGYNNDSFGSYNNWTNTAALGVDYFFNPAVALGPALTWTHNFGNNGRSANNTYSVGANFHIFL